MLRIPLYEEAQQIFKDHAPWLTIAHTVQTVVFRNEIIDLRLNPFGGFTYYGVDIQRGAQRGRVRP
jgi:dipeptide transport system substrate-binding protein